MARFTSSTFAKLALDAAQKKAFTGWVKNEGPTAHDALTRMLADGFKISISWVDNQNAFCFSMIGTDSTPQHRNMVMTSWSDDLEEVMLLATYKHYVVCNSGAWPSEDAGQRWG